MRVFLIFNDFLFLSRTKIDYHFFFVRLRYSVLTRFAIIFHEAIAFCIFRMQHSKTIDSVALASAAATNIFFSIDAGVRNCWYYFEQIQLITNICRLRRWWHRMNTSTSAIATAKSALAHTAQPHTPTQTHILHRNQKRVFSFRNDALQHQHRMNNLNEYRNWKHPMPRIVRHIYTQSRSQS